MQLRLILTNGVKRILQILTLSVESCARSTNFTPLRTLPEDGAGQSTGRVITYRSRNKMVAVCQTTFSNSFSWMKIVLFWFKFHWNLFPKIELLKSLCWINYWPGVENVPSRFGAENPYEYHHLDLKLVCPKRPVDLIVQSHWNFARNSTASLLDNWKTRIRNSDL